MCGLAGYLGSFDAASVLPRMEAALRHRGPDGSGVWSDESVGLAHRRLAVIDLTEAGAQPMISANDEWVISFNGEIYNFHELRRQLPAHVVLRGHSDTEVLLEYVAAFGVRRTVSEADGMFALALWNRRSRTLYLARDRFGEKPLYVMRSAKGLLFASELGALLRVSDEPKVDRRALAGLVRYGYVPSGSSIVDGATQVLPGTFLRVESDEAGVSVSQERYWDTQAVAAQSRARSLPTFNAYRSEVYSALRDAVEREVVSDVPIGAFLSGGIDSSLVVALMKQLGVPHVSTFTIRFSDPRHDEGQTAAEIARALGTDHHERVIDEHDLLSIVERLPDIYTEPFADASQLPTVLLAAFAKEYVTVALSGDGADELFGGYRQYFSRDTIGEWSRRIPAPLRRSAASILSLSRRIGAQQLVKSLLNDDPDRWLPNSVLRLERSLREINHAKSYDDSLARIVDPYAFLASDRGDPLGDEDFPTSADWPSWSTSAEGRMIWDTDTYLPNDVLVKVDRAAMASSLETRAPFLSKSVFEVAWRGTPDYRLHEGRGKHVLRSILADFLPPLVVNLPKKGFSVPLDEWLRGALRDWAGDMLATQDALTYFSRSAVDRLWSEHQSRARDHSSRLWSLVTFLQWSSRHIKK